MALAKRMLAFNRFTTFIPIDPVPKGRPRASSRGGFVRLYTPSKTRNFESEITTHCRAKMGTSPVFMGPVKVVISFGIVRPKSVSRKSHTVRPDLDNLSKAVLDALNGVVFHDDAQVVVLELSKNYSTKPSVFIEVISWEN